MKKIFIILLTAIIPLTSDCQSDTNKEEIIATFTITDGTSDGIDMTPTLLKAGAYTVFYTNLDDNLIYMANVWPNSKSQSYGPMYGAESKKGTYENYEAEFFNFNWKYTNTYDDETGTAKVEVIKIYKPQGVAFNLKIITPDLTIIIYKGYMDGTIDFSIYD
jgi:hypothetical protein